MSKSKYVSLHTHSDFSFKDSTCKIKPLVARAKELGYPALGLTDHGNVHGAMQFYRECLKQGVKPILGVEAYIVEDVEAKSRSANHITLLAMNNKGWENIVKLVTFASNHFYYQERIDLNALCEHQEGIIVLSGCMSSTIAKAMIKDEDDKAEEVARRLQKVFGDRFFLELQMVNRPNKNYIPEQNVIIRKSRALAKKLGIKCVASNDVHYIEEDDRITHEILKAIQGKNTLDDAPKSKDNPSGRMVFNGYDYFLQTYEQMKERFKAKEVSITAEIAKRCNVTLDFNPGAYMPRYSGNMSDDQVYDLLVDTCRSRVMDQKLFTKRDKEYVDRIMHEFADIKEANLQHYFLIVYEITKFADEAGIARGYGRGSAAGSLVSYCLGITKLDPIRFGLIWERFYNKGRAGSMPDIDLDFCIENREKIIDHLRKKFGADRIFPMCTFGTLAGKAALKDVGRTIGLSYGYMNYLTSLIPAKLQDPENYKGHIIDDAVAHVPELKELNEGVDQDVKLWSERINETTDQKLKQVLQEKIAERSSKLKMLFHHARKLENCKRQRSGHACALLMSDRDIAGTVPLTYDNRNKKHVTSWDMYTLEDLGYLKLDILGVKSVTVIDKIRKSIVAAKKPHAVSESETLDDPMVYQTLSLGRTIGIFQLESYLGANWAKKVGPKNIDEWSDIISLIRPAVLETGMADSYVKARDTGTIECVHPDLTEILQPTNGIMLYQEQMIRMSQIMAGFSLNKSDVLRAAVGKKKIEKMKSLHADFVQGCLDNGHDKEVVNKLWELVKAAAGYSFNKSHSMSYAILGYVMAWYKIHFPIEFYKIMLQMSTNEQNTHEEIAKLYYDALMNGVDILPPDVSKANADFEIYDGKIYYGFQHIKSLGKKSMRQVREFKNICTYREFLDAICEERIKPGVTMALVRCGALDHLIDPTHNDRVTFAMETELFFSLTQKRQIAVLKLMEKLEEFNKLSQEERTAIEARTIQTYEALEAEAQNMEDEWVLQQHPDGNRFRQAIDEWHDRKRDKIRNERLLTHLDDIKNAKTDTTRHIIMMAQNERHFLGIYINYSEADAYMATDAVQPLGSILRQAQPKSHYEALLCIENAREILSKKKNKLILADVFDTTGKATAMLCGNAYSKYKDLMLQYPVLQVVVQMWGGTLMIVFCINPPKKEK